MVVRGRLTTDRAMYISSHYMIAPLLKIGQRVGDARFEPQACPLHIRVAADRLRGPHGAKHFRAGDLRDVRH